MNHARASRAICGRTTFSCGFLSLHSCRPLSVGARAIAGMLAQWSGQERRVPSAIHRRFLGVTGVAHSQVHAVVIYNNAQAQAASLSVVLLNARPDTGHRELGSLAIDGIEPVAAAVALPDDVVLPADVAGRAAACQAVSYIQLVEPAQLIAVGFVNPQLRDHALTGSVLYRVLDAVGPERQAITFRQVFSFDGSGSPLQDRIILSYDDHIVPDQLALLPPHMSLLDAMQARDEQAFQAVQDPAVAAADAEAAADEGMADVLLEPNDEPVAPGGAIVPAGPPPPAHPGPAPFIPAVPAGVAPNAAGPGPAFQQAPVDHIPPPQAFGAPARAHWAADVAGGMPAPPGVPRAAAAGGMPAPVLPPPLAPHVVPAAPQVAVGNLPAAQRPPAHGVPLHGAAAGLVPRFIDMSAVPQCVRLFAECLPHEMSHMASLDDLARILAPVGQSPPAGAFLPADDPMARLEYVEDRLSAILPHSTMPPLRAGSGWQGVYQAARSLSRVALPSVGASADLSSSFGRSAERHLTAQLNVQAAPFVPPSAAVAQLDPLHAAAIRAAGVAVDQEGVLPLPQRAMSIASTHLSSTIPPGDSIHQPLPAVRGLGSAMANLPASLQIIESANNRNFASTSSAHMIAISSRLNSASSSFYPMAAEQLRQKVGKEPPILSDARTAELRNCVSSVLRGKPLSVTELMISGSGGSTLLDPLRAGNVARAKEVMGWMDFIVRLFWPADRIIADDPGGQTFFGIAADRLGSMIDVDKHAPSVVADFVQHRIRAVQDAFRRFYSGELLLRPVYSVSWFSGAGAKAALEEIVRMHQASSLPNIASQAADLLRAQGWTAPSAPPPAGSFASAPAPASSVVSKRAAKRARQAQLASSSSSSSAVPSAGPATSAAAPAPAPATAAGAGLPASSAAPPAPARVMAVNPNIIGTLHVGVASGDLMASFSTANRDAAGNGRCFNFWRRGQCRNGDGCRFSHV